MKLSQIYIDELKSVKSISDVLASILFISREYLRQHGNINSNKHSFIKHQFSRQKRIEIR